MALLAGDALSTVKAQQASASSNGSSTTADYRDGLEHEAFYLINQYRKANKLPIFQWDGSIAKVARGHSKDMAVGDVDFGHEGFSKRITLLSTEMIGLKGAGENVFKCDDPEEVAKAAVTTWLNSPHHLENIRGDYNYSGMGVWQDDKGVIFFTQIFVKLKPVAETAQAAPEPAVTTPFGLLATPKTR